MKQSNVTPITQRTDKRGAVISTRSFRDQIVGKTIQAVVAKPGRAGQPPMVLMMQFDDGTVVEWVSPRSDAILRRALSTRPIGSVSEPETLQLPLMEPGHYQHA
ncbi:MAG TPA: hypothetical protein VIC53_04785 [Wenzhouxiangella sp.]